MPRKAAPTLSLDELWLHSLQKLTAYAAHDFKGALNGLSVNLEVVRSRAERENAPASDVLKFAGVAIDQLTLVIRMSGALLSLGRLVQGRADVSLIARQIVHLIEDTLRSDGGAVEIEVGGGMAAETAAPAAAVRLVLAEVLVANARKKGRISVRVRAFPTPNVEIRPAPDPALSGEIMEALTAAGITVQTDGHGISIGFPGPAEPPTEEA